MGGVGDLMATSPSIWSVLVLPSSICMGVVLLLLIPEFAWHHTWNGWVMHCEGVFGD